jgi:hypothetical protein
MYHSGELWKLWSMATQTELTFNLVSITACKQHLLSHFSIVCSRPDVCFDAYYTPGWVPTMDRSCLELVQSA